MTEEYILEALSPNLMVEDVNKSIEFYQKYLGFQVLATVPETGNFDWAMIMRDKVTIMLHLKKSMQSEYPTFEAKPVGGAIVLYTTINHLDKLYEALQGENFVIKEKHQTFYGMKEFSIRDNDGYIITFAERMIS